MKSCGILGLTRKKDSIYEVSCFNKPIYSLNLKGVAKPNIEAVVKQNLIGKTVNICGVTCKIISLSNGYYEDMLVHTVFGTDVTLVNKLSKCKFLSMAIPSKFSIEGNDICMCNMVGSQVCVVVDNYGYTLHCEKVVKPINEYTFDEFKSCLEPLSTATEDDFHKGVFTLFNGSVRFVRSEAGNTLYNVYVMGADVGYIEFEHLFGDYHILSLLKYKVFKIQGIPFKFLGTYKTGMYIANVITHSRFYLTKDKTFDDFKKSIENTSFEVGSTDYMVLKVERKFLRIAIGSSIVGIKLSVFRDGKLPTQEQLKNALVYDSATRESEKFTSYLSGVLWTRKDGQDTEICLFGHTIKRFHGELGSLQDIERVLCGTVIDILHIPMIITSIAPYNIILDSNLLDSSIRIVSYSTRYSIRRNMVLALPKAVLASLGDIGNRSKWTVDDMDKILSTVFSKEILEDSRKQLLSLGKDFTRDSINKLRTSTQRKFGVKSRSKDSKLDELDISKKYLSLSKLPSKQEHTYGNGYMTYNTEAQIRDAISEYYGKDMGFRLPSMDS